MSWPMAILPQISTSGFFTDPILVAAWPFIQRMAIPYIILWSDGGSIIHTTARMPNYQTHLHSGFFTDHVLVAIWSPSCGGPELIYFGPLRFGQRLKSRRAISLPSHKYMAKAKHHRPAPTESIPYGIISLIEPYSHMVLWSGILSVYNQLF